MSSKTQHQSWPPKLSLMISLKGYGGAVLCYICLAPATHERRHHNSRLWNTKIWWRGSQAVACGDLWFFFFYRGTLPWFLDWMPQPPLAFFHTILVFWLHAYPRIRRPGGYWGICFGLSERQSLFSGSCYWYLSRMYTTLAWPSLHGHDTGVDLVS